MKFGIDRANSRFMKTGTLNVELEPGTQSMKELIVISGKGGTGKTSLMAAFSSLAENKVLCDADVDAADLHLIMNPKVDAAAVNFSPETPPR